ncbi:MAG: putative metal-dependent RNase [Rubritalea sp.]|jgi:predicted metal-dependent RNase|tara:strand:+ start:4511 stop:5821 length:1311 start_codon:yes stop_codon:yes gene_type:complete
MLDTGDCKIVFDAGMHPKQEAGEAIPQYDELQHNSVDAIFLTHSHLDHAGTLPVLMRDQPDAEVYMTAATAGLTDALLHNSVNVMQSKRTELGITEYPLYGHRELDRLETRWRKRDYGERIDITMDTSAQLYDAGHILGSSGVMVEKDDQRVFYTGDINFEDQTLITGAKFPEEGIDTLIIETTRGSVPRDPAYEREKEEQKLCDAILKTLEGGGSALIPVFAMGKTQELLTMLHKFKESGRIPEKTPVFIGGLSTKMTILFDEFADTTPRQMPGFQIFRDMDVRAASKKGSRKPVVYQPGAIYALSSGMMTEKTISNGFAHGFISNPKNSLLFVGYAAPDSPAGAIRASKQGDVIELSPDLTPVQFNCDMKIFDFSGHSDREALLAYMLKVAPRKMFLVHGDIGASEWFRDQLAEKLPDCDVIIPEPKKIYDLDQ